MKKQIQSKAHKALKQNKGITLIALIITIVVLLILAVVAINSIRNDGIISHAGNVANRYNEAVENEQQHLQNYLDYLDNANGSSKWTQTGTSVTNGKVTLEVGTTVTGYTSPEGTTDPGWAVLGAENGKLLLVSEEGVATGMESNDEAMVYLFDTDNNGKADAIDLLNSECASYLNPDLADNARSITVEDINRVTGYNPKNVGVYDPGQIGEGTPYGSGTIEQYNNVVTYTLLEGDSGAEPEISWESATGKGLYTSVVPYFFAAPNRMMATDEMWNSLDDADELGFKRVSSVELISNYYEYYVATLNTNDSTEYEFSINKDSLAFQLLFNSRVRYLLANEVVRAGNSSCGTEYGLAGVQRSFVGFGFSMNDETAGSVGYSEYHPGTGGGYFVYNPEMRPVITLKSDINIDETGKIS